MDDRTKRVVALNDKLRTELVGGRVMFTRGVTALDKRSEILRAIAKFEEFTEDNDPYGEHDFGAICVDGYELFWKIDYYDLSLTFHSPDKSDARVTERVMTIMLAEEY